MEQQFLETFDTLNTLEVMMKSVENMDNLQVAGLLIDSLEMPYAEQLKEALKECGGNPISALSEMPPEELNQMLKKLDMLDSLVPGFGYVKAGVHLALGDKDAAVESLMAANKCMGNYSKAAAVSVAGPAGAIAVDIAVDMLNTAIASMVYGEFRPQGIVKIAADMYTDIQEANYSKLAGNLIDMFGKSAVESFAGDNKLTEQIGNFLVGNAKAAVSFAAGNKDEGKREMLGAFGHLTGAFDSYLGEAGQGVMKSLNDSLGSEVVTGLGLEAGVAYGVDLASSAMQTGIASAIDGQYSPQGSIKDLQGFASASEEDKAAMAVNMLKSKFGDDMFQNVDMDTAGKPAFNYDAMAEKGKNAVLDKLKESSGETLSGLMNDNYDAMAEKGKNAVLDKLKESSGETLSGLVNDNYDAMAEKGKNAVLDKLKESSGETLSGLVNDNYDAMAEKGKNAVLDKLKESSGETLSGLVNDMQSEDNSMPEEKVEHVQFRSKANNKFVCVDTGDVLIANRDEASCWETFEMTKHGGGDVVSLRAMKNHMVVSADNNGASPLAANQQIAGDSEKFQLVSHPAGDISLKSLANGKYVCANNGGNEPLINDRDAAGEWESFSLQYV